MPKYSRQLNDFNCGPTAILNAMKWAGARVSNDFIPFLEFGCRIDAADDDLGTTFNDFDRMIRYCGKNLYKTRRTKHLTMKKLRAHLMNGGAVALDYVDDSTVDGGHSTLIIGMKGSMFSFVNDSVNQTIVNRRAESVQKIISSPHSSIWLLTKIPNATQQAK